MTTQRKFGDYVDNSKLTRGELSIFIEDAVAAGFKDDGDSDEFPFTGALTTGGEKAVGGRKRTILGDFRCQDVTHEYQGISKQSKDSQENVITGTGVYRGRANGYDVIIHEINHEEGIAYGYDTQDGHQERYRVETGDRIGLCSICDWAGTGVDRKDMNSVDMATINLGSHSHTNTTPISDVINVSIDWAEPSKTPAEKQGWAVGDIGIVKQHTGFLEAGTVVELHLDDGSVCPQFEDVSAPCKEFRYENLDCVVRIGTKQEFLDMFFDTPAKQQGFGIDVYGVVNQENSGTIDAGSVVKLYDDDKSNGPLWKVLVGHSKHNCCDAGQQGAFEDVSRVTQIPLNKDLYDKLSNS